MSLASIFEGDVAVKSMEQEVTLRSFIACRNPAGYAKTPWASVVTSTGPKTGVPLVQLKENVIDAAGLPSGNSTVTAAAAGRVSMVIANNTKSGIQRKRLNFFIKFSPFTIYWLQTQPLMKAYSKNF